MNIKKVIGAVAASVGLGAIGAGVAENISNDKSSAVENTQRDKSEADRDMNKVEMPINQVSTQSNVSNVPIPYYSDGGVSPKVYGIYLSRTGKNKQNNLKHIRYAKMRS